MTGPETLIAVCYAALGIISLSDVKNYRCSSLNRILSLLVGVAALVVSALYVFGILNCEEWPT
jgi:hypothetical protein